MTRNDTNESDVAQLRAEFIRLSNEQDRAICQETFLGHDEQRDKERDQRRDQLRKLLERVS